MPLLGELKLLPGVVVPELLPGDVLPGVVGVPGRCCGDPLCEALPAVELPGVPAPLRLPPKVELPELIPDCDPLVPGVPTLLPGALCCCCIATVRVKDSTMRSSRATRASMEPEPEMLEGPDPGVPLPSVPLLELEDVPSVPDPPTDDDCPSPPLDDELVPGWPGCPAWLEELPIEPWREDELPLWPLCPAPDAPLDPMELPGLLDPLWPAELLPEVLACP